MQNSQSSDPIVAQLLEIDTNLAAQEVELTLQLQSIQEKRHSLKNVISLFPPVDTTAHTSVVTPVVEEQAEPSVQKMATPKLEGVTADTTEAAPQPPKRQNTNNLFPSSIKPSKKSSLTPIKEATAEPETWQKYLRDEFNNASLPIAVSEVMQQHPEQVLEITAILNNIFSDEIPKEVKSKARERVSNVLSVGAKKGKWYRGLAGRYSMSSAAVENNSVV